MPPFIITALLSLILLMAPPVQAGNAGSCATTSSACYDQLLSWGGSGAGEFSVRIPNNTNPIAVSGAGANGTHIRAHNNPGTLGYLKLHNSTAAACGSGTPADRMMIPGNTHGQAIIFDSALGDSNADGITACATGGYADKDLTALAANPYSLSIAVTSSSTNATLTASPTVLTSRGSAILTWTSSNATSCAGTNFSTRGSVSGSTSVSPTTTTTYNITCSGSVNSATAYATVTVNPARVVTYYVATNGSDSNDGLAACRTGHAPSR